MLMWTPADAARLQQIARCAQGLMRVWAEAGSVRSTLTVYCAKGHIVFITTLAVCRQAGFEFDVVWIGNSPYNTCETLRCCIFADWREPVLLVLKKRFAT